MSHLQANRHMQKLSRMNTDSKYTRRKPAIPHRSVVHVHTAQIYTERTSHIINRNTGCVHECKHSPDSTKGVPDSSKTAVMNAASRSNISSSTRSCLRYLLEQVHDFQSVNAWEQGYTSTAVAVQWQLVLSWCSNHKIYLTIMISRE